MDTRSVAEVAEAAGTTVPRVMRRVERLNLTPLDVGRGRRFTSEQVNALISDMGRVPSAWTRGREEGFVLAALNLRPLGLRSRRAVARASGISPTTASKVLDRLIAEDVVAVEHVTLAEGDAVDAALYVINRDSSIWLDDLATSVRLIRPPQRRHTPASGVPRYLWHHFWNADPSRLRISADADYIAARLVRSGDPAAIGWVATNLPAAAIRKAASLRGTPASLERLIHNIAAGAPA